MTWRREKGIEVCTAGGGVLVRWVTLGAVAESATAGVAIYLTSPAHDLHDPHHGLQQLDMLYLDESAAGLDQLGIDPGRPAVVVFCADPSCPLPELPDAQGRALHRPETGAAERASHRGGASRPRLTRSWTPPVGSAIAPSTRGWHGMRPRSASSWPDCREAHRAPGGHPRPGPADRGLRLLRYAELGAQFHFWLHVLFGGALGLAALTVLRGLTALLRHRDPASGAVAPWEVGWLEHLYSALPDVLFLSSGVLHVLWMDVFAFHITLHFIPAPLLTTLALFLLGLLGYGLAASRHPAPPPARSEPQSSSRASP